jgi:sialic acid synthase SpsE
LRERCQALGIGFLSTPFDLPSVDLLVGELGMRRLKMPSGEITNAPLLLKAARTGAALIVSTGMCTMKDVEQALGVIAFGYTGGDTPASRPAFADAFASAAGRAALEDTVTLLHCTTEYPAPPDEVNLKAMDTLRDAFGLPIGYSDHTKGIAVSIAAVARGAVVIEKHFSLDRNLPGPDHKASLEPDELGAMIEAIRTVEPALGDGHKRPTPSEQPNMAVARKSLVAAHDIRTGELFTEKTLTTKRPGTGISPMEYWDWLGRRADRDYPADTLIEP